MKRILWSLVFLFGKIPFRLRSKLGAALGYLASLIPSRDHKIALLQIRYFLSPKDPLKVLRQTYAHFGSTFFECLNLAPMIRHPENFIDFPAWPEAQRLLNQKRGIVALTAHLGNWDAMGAYFANKEVPLLAIAKQARNPAVHHVLEKLRNSFGFKTLWRANKKGIATILESLRAGQVVAAVIDQDTRVTSIPIPFFGINASTPSTIIEIGKKSDSLFVTAFVVKSKSGRFEIRVQEIDNKLSTEEILTEYNKRLEFTIREYPGQWAWFHKRWRTLPTGERLGGKKYKSFLEEELSNQQSVVLNKGANVS